MKFVNRLYCQDDLGEYWIDIIDGKYEAWVKEATDNVDHYDCPLMFYNEIGHKFNTLHEAKVWIKQKTMEFEYFTRKTI